LPSFELFYIILNILDSLPHIFELFDLLLHLFASNKRNLSQKAHNLGREIILQVDDGLVEFFVTSDPKACFSNLLLKRIVFKVLNP
jgi:hypothetical protein